MNRSLSKYFVIMAVGAFFTGGCAKQELVKKDESIPSVATAKPGSISSVKPSVKETAIKEQPVKEAPITGQIPKESKAGGQTEAALEKVFFDFDSYLLTPSARDTLVKNAAAMKGKSDVTVRIEGHCDERGSDEYNLALGEKRGRAAMQYLVTTGIPVGRLSVVSYGKEKPADPGHDDAAWAKNRRDEFVVISR